MRTQLLCLLFFTACGGAELEKHQAAIINGEACSADQLPTTVAVLEFESGFACGGTLIAPDVVMTAAHCVKEGQYYYAVSFVADLRGGDLLEDTWRVASFVKHPEYNPDAIDDLEEGLGNLRDVALLFLEWPITQVEPAILITPEEARELEAGLEVRIAGWGRQLPEDAFATGVKHCANAVLNEVGDFELQIGDGPSSARKCHGDSGGPTFADVTTDSHRKERVIGITSRSYGTDGCQRGAIDTKASAFFGWIDEELTQRCADNSRSWCDVEGAVPADFYNAPEQGGCSVGGSSRSGLGLALLMLLWTSRGNRRRCV